MTVRCPCGTRCRGADNLGRAPDCFESYVGDFLPLRFRGGGSLGGMVAGAAATAFLQTFNELNWEVYQCPSCGCEVVFMTYKTSSGINRRRCADTATC